ncbi:hypothetical protein PI126_g19001 [Phytophthora idaei]|nr:hypothetical protein PI126_g19001 [Phytophthora idaei]
MARIWKTGGTSTQGRPFPHRKRKPSTGTAAKIRARKQARKQARVAASVGAKGSEDTVEKTGGTMVSKTTVPKTKQGCEYESAACAAS